MNKKIPIELLDKYLEGNCTADELIEVQIWFNSFEKEHDYISGLSAEEKVVLERFMFSKILMQIDEVPQEIAPTVPLKKRYGWIGAAAAIIIVFGLYFYNSDKSSISEKSIVVAKSENIHVENESTSLIKRLLPDSSIVWLSPGASIRYKSDFIGEERQISMNGECFFDVTKNQEHPFVISSKHLVTKVWGTSFRVNDQTNAKIAQVSVVTGKVSVKASSSEVMLMPNQRVTYTVKSKMLSSVSSVEDKTLGMWTRTKITFDGVPLEDVLVVLNKKFNVNIQVSDTSLNAYNLNADFSEFNLPEILESLKKTLNVDYTIVNNNILLKNQLNRTL